MFALTARHLKALESAPDEAFAYRLVEHVRLVFATETDAIEDQDLLQRVRTARERARELELTTERNIALFIDLGFGLGEDFESRPENKRVAALIGDITSHEDVRIARVYLELSRQD